MNEQETVRARLKLVLKWNHIRTARRTHNGIDTISICVDLERKSSRLLLQEAAVPSSLEISITKSATAKGDLAETKYQTRYSLPVSLKAIKIDLYNVLSCEEFVLFVVSKQEVIGKKKVFSSKYFLEKGINNKVSSPKINEKEKKVSKVVKLWGGVNWKCKKVFSFTLSFILAALSFISSAPSSYANNTQVNTS